MSVRAPSTRSRSARKSTSGASRGQRATHAAKNKAELQVVRRGSRRLIKRTASRRLVPFALLGGIIALAIVFGVLLEQVVLAQSAFKLASVREQVAGAEARHQRLLLEAAKLESSDRIEQFAREELGMVNPPAGHVEYLSADIYPRTTRARFKDFGRGLPPRGANAAGASSSDAAP